MFSCGELKIADLNADPLIGVRVSGRWVLSVSVFRLYDCPRDPSYLSPKVGEGPVFLCRKEKYGPRGFFFRV